MLPELKLSGQFRELISAQATQQSTIKITFVPQKLERLLRTYCTHLHFTETAEG